MSAWEEMVCGMSAWGETWELVYDRSALEERLELADGKSAWEGK
jgi:hypothetical protein